MDRIPFQRVLLLAAAVAGGSSCQGKATSSSKAATPSEPPPVPVSRPAAPASPATLPPKPDDDALPEASGRLAPERRAIQVVGGKERVVDADLAADKGLTIVDLSDDFAPFIFQDGKAADGAPLPNRYRAVFVGLANDRTDGDGEPLPPGERNYLELYGVPPSLSVMRKRFLEDGARTCESTVDTAKLLAVDSIGTWGKTTEKKESAKHHFRVMRLETAQKKAGASTLEELAAKDTRYAREVKEHLRMEAERTAFV
ncbi:MAG TPA: hypothetical protein VF524_09540, partial [Polyangia bacterium]